MIDECQIIYSLIHESRNIVGFKLSLRNVIKTLQRYLFDVENDSIVRSKIEEMILECRALKRSDVFIAKQSNPLGESK